MFVPELCAKFSLIRLQGRQKTRVSLPKIEINMYIGIKKNILYTQGLSIWFWDLEDLRLIKFL